VNVAPVDVRRALFAGCTGFTELRSWGPGAIDGPPQDRAFHDVHDEDSWRADCRRLADAGQLFWGPATRRTNRSGKKDNLLHVPALWADQDFLREDGTGYPEADLRKDLATFPLPPSITLHSGNGLQSLWLLDVPADAQAQQQEIERLNAGLARVLSGDDVGNVDRILRVPGSWHRKQPSQPRRVTVETFEPTRRYSLAQLQAVLEELGAFDQAAPQTPPPPPRHHGGDGPGSAYNAATDIQARTLHLLQQHGWTVDSEQGSIIYLARPGKRRGTSASLGHGQAGLFYPWSTNGAPFQPRTSYSPFGVYAELEHAGDYRAAAKALAADGFGRPSEPTTRQQRRAQARTEAKAEASQPAGLLSIGDFLAQPDDDAEWLIDGLIGRGTTNLLASKPKAGKSTLARAAAVAVAQGRPFLGRACVPGVVWYLALEGRAADHRLHFRALGARATDPIRVFCGQVPKRALEQVRLWAEAEVPDLVIIDTLQRFLRASDSDAYAEWSNLFDPVIALTRELGCAVLFLHHARKMAEGGASLDAVHGSVAITGSVDNTLLLTRSGQTRTVATVQRIGIDLEECLLLLDEDGWPSLGGSKAEAEREAMAVELLEALREQAQPLGRDAWFDLVEGRTQVKVAAMRLLEQQHCLGREGQGARGNPFRYRPVPGSSFRVSGTRNRPPQPTPPPSDQFDSCSLVPPKGWEQENNHSRSHISATATESVSCSRSHLQGHEARGSGNREGEVLDAVEV
jgi:hypothetical protein